MSTVAPAIREAPRVDPALAGLIAVLSGPLLSLIGASWDIQWHHEVGPDTFFTLPHLFIYAGTAIAGLTSLVMVLRATALQRAGHPADPAVGGRPIRVFGGTFTAPLGYLVAGTSAAAFLLYGLMDLQWHSVYGFDAVLDSPPHVALFLTISLTMSGTVIVATASRAHGWARAGTIAAITLLAMFSPVITAAFDALPAPFDPKQAGLAFFGTLMLVLGAQLLRSNRAPVLIGLGVAVAQAVLWFVSPWASHAYADSVGLPLRDGVAGDLPRFPMKWPMLFVVAAVVVAVLLARLGSDRWRAPVAGAAGGLIIGSAQLGQEALLGELGPAHFPGAGELVTIAAVGALVGALAGFFATRLATLLLWEKN